MTHLDAIDQYFGGEQSAALLLQALGLAAAGFSFWLWRSGHPLRAMVFSLALVAMGQLAVGVGLYARTPAQVTALRRDLVERPVEARDAERARMVAVQRSFVWIERIEALVILLGVALVLLRRDHPTAVGVGMGLAIQGAVMLAFDVFASQRGAAWLAWLSRAH